MSLRLVLLLPPPPPLLLAMRWRVLLLTSLSSATTLRCGSEALLLLIEAVVTAEVLQPCSCWCGQVGRGLPHVLLVLSLLLVLLQVASAVMVCVVCAASVSLDTGGVMCGCCSSRAMWLWPVWNLHVVVTL